MGDGPVIVVIDDEAQIRRLLRISLEAYGYRVHDAPTAGEGLAEVTKVQPDLVILDLGLPDMDGIEALKKIRSRSSIPVIVLTVRDSEDDKIALLDAGADDYITKPFGTGELLARLRASLRRRAVNSEDGIIATGDIVIDLTRRTVERDGAEVKLTPTEYSLLRLLAVNAGKVVTQNQILGEMWGASPSSVDPSYLRVYVLQLRRKLEDDPSQPKLIITEPGVGYRLLVVEARGGGE